MKNVYLIGYMGAGKSTAGKQLARLLGYSFIDLDRAFEESYRISIMDFFEKYDEAAFRVLERKLLETTFSLESHVISTGGGTACYSDNIHLINQHGISVYIQMHPDSLFSRLKNAKRPRPRISALNDDELRFRLKRTCNTGRSFINWRNIILKVKVSILKPWLNWLLQLWG